jgi:hypothetical protein
MSDVKTRLPSADQLRLDGERGRFVDRVEAYLPDSLYRESASVPTNGLKRRTKSPTRAAEKTLVTQPAPSS